MAHRQYELTAELYNGGALLPLDVKSMSVSVDIDRVPFVEVRLRTGAIGSLIDPDPRENDRLRWRVIERDQAGAVVRQLPATGYGITVLREASRDIHTNEWDLLAQSFESLLDDKRRVSASTFNNPAITNVLAAVQWAVTDAGLSWYDFPTTVTDTASSSGALIPAGDRRIWRQGEPLSAVYESEVDASGRRFRADITGLQLLLELETRDPLAGTTPVILRTADAPGVIDGHEATIISGREITRRDDWADAVLVRSQYTNEAGATVTAFQPPTGGGANTRAVVVESTKPNPGVGAADKLTSRYRLRGRRYEFTTRAHFLAQPRMPASVRIRTETARAAVLIAVTWDFPAGTMTVKAETDS